MDMDAGVETQSPLISALLVTASATSLALGMGASFVEEMVEWPCIRLISSLLYHTSVIEGYLMLPK